jgi:Putative DNA-binding domain
MKTVITTRGNLAQKLEQAAETFQLAVNDVVEAKRGVSAERRMDIYASGYVLRLLECMKCDFPGLQAFMGEQLFDLFAKAYIVSLPPQSWSLYHLSERFPPFLRDTEPPTENTGELQQILAQLPAEIAAFERTRAELGGAKGTEELPGFNGPHLFDPIPYLVGEIPLAVSPALRLLKQKFPLNEFLTRLEKGETPNPPAPQTTYVIFTRLNYRIRMAEIEHWQYVFLNACREGKNIHAGAQQAAGETGMEVQTIQANLLVWLPVVVEMGAILPPTK